MLSKEITGAIEMLRKGKEENKGKIMTPEAALADRKQIDGILGSLPLREGISIEKIVTDDVTGEFYRLVGNDPEKRRGKVLLFLHGGGFINGSVLSRRKLCHDIMARAKSDAFSVEYGQWPESEHPRALNDCVAAYDWLLERGYRAGDIQFFGESAGAMLTLTTLLYLRDQGRDLPDRALVFSPVAGQDMKLPSHWEMEEKDPMISYEPVVPYYEHADFLSPYVSPGYGDFKGFPPLSIHAGSEEVLVDDSRLIYDLCREAGVEVSLKIWDGLFHVFPLFASPESDRAIEEIGRFFSGDI